MADAQLKAVITAEDKASKVIADVGGSLDKVQGKLESMQPAFKKMAAVGTVAFGAIASLAYKAIKDYSDVEAINKQLEHAVIDVTHATREQLKATSDLADALERKGVLDGDNIKLGLAQLSTFGLSNEAVRNLGGSLADLAVNQYGVSASGDQLADSANMIAKALNGQFGLLEKSGIRFSEAQKHMIEFGTETEKVTAINQGFQQNLKYTNEVALTTFEGKLAAAKVQLGNVSENIGKALLPALQSLLEKVSPIIKKFADWSQDHPQLIARILTVSAAIAGLVAVIGGIGLILPSVIAGIKLLGTALSFLATDPIGLTLVAIGLVATGLVLLYQKSEAFRDGVNKLGNTVMSYLKPVLDLLWTTIQTQLLPALEQLWSTLKDELWPALKELWEAIQPLIPLFELWLKVMLILQAAGLLVLVEVLKTVVQWLTQFLTGLTILTDFIAKVATKIFKDIASDIDTITSAFKSLVEWISRAIEKWNSFRASGASLNPFSQSFALPFLNGRASGGSVSPNRPFMVGENGPELFTPQTYGSISNGGGASIVINLTGNTFMGREGIAEQIGNELMKVIKRNVQV